MPEHIHQNRKNTASATGNTFKAPEPSRGQRNTAQLSQESVGGISARLIDHRPQAIAQRQLQDIGNNSPQARQLKTYGQMMQNSPRAMQLKALQAMMQKPLVQRAEDDEALQTKSASQGTAQLVGQADSKPNNTGLPNQLKAGIESLSGMSMDHVKVNYNSGKPAQLNAHAYAQGSEIHVAPGQERHVPHEAWHVVQQAQGRVRPTMQMKQGVAVNDDVGLEAEADVMGAKALSAGANLFAGQGGQHAGMHVDTVDATATAGASRQLVTVNAAQGSSAPVQMYGETLQRLALYFGVEASFANVAAALGMAPTTLYFALTAIATVAAIWSVSKIIGYLMGTNSLVSGKLNVVGENHDQSNPQRPAEINYTKRILGGDAGYWEEHQFALGDDEDWGDDKYLRMADLVFRFKNYYAKMSGSALDFALAENLDDIQKAKVLKTLSASMKQGKNRFFDGLSAEFMSINTLRKNGKFPYGNKISQKAFLEWGIALSAVKKNHDLVLRSLDQDDALDGYDNLVMAVADVMIKVEDFGKKSIESHFVDEPDITQQRSEHMHDAANDSAASVGVWKIGQEHVNDIEKLNVKRKYNLVHRDNFIKALS